MSETPYNDTEKFSQPVDAIHIVSRAPGPRTLLTDEVLAAAASRVKGGEPIADVALELAIQELALTGEVNGTPENTPLRSATVATPELVLAGDKIALTLEAVVAWAFAKALRELPNWERAVAVIGDVLGGAIVEPLRRAQAAGGNFAAAAVRAQQKQVRVAASKPMPPPLKKSSLLQWPLFTKPASVPADTTASGWTEEFAFDLEDPESALWATQHAAELVTQVTKTTRDGIRKAISEMLTAGVETSSAQAKDRIAKLVNDPVRAQLIARTESMIAVHAGQRQAWSQAEDQGLIPPTARRVWITTADDRLCPVCEALDGQTAELDGSYGDGIDAPPAHPNCRCTEGLQ